MSQPTRAQLEAAMAAADAAGDQEAAAFFGQELKNYKPTLAGEAQAVGGAALRAVPKLIGGIADLGALGVEKAGGWLRGLGIPEMPSMPLRDGVKKPSDAITAMVGESRQPETNAGRFAAHAAEGAVGGAAFAGLRNLQSARLAANALGSGAAGGLGGELAVQGMAKRDPITGLPAEEPIWARILGSVVGGVGGGLAMRGAEELAGRIPGVKTPSTFNDIAAAARDVPDAELAKAGTQMRAASAAGVESSLPQHLDRPTALGGLHSRVTGSEHGSGITSLLSRQDAQAEALLQRGLPGPAVAPTEAAKTAAGAAARAVEGVRQQGLTATKPLYERWRDANPQDVQNAFLDILKEAKIAGPQTPVGQELRRISSMLGSVVEKTQPDGTKVRVFQPTVGADALDNALAAVKQVAEKQSSEHFAGAIRRGAQPLEDLVAKISNDYPRGQQMTKSFNENVLKPMKADSVGRLAEGTAEAAPNVQRLVQLFDSKQGIRAQSIARLEGDLTKVDPQAFPTAVRGWMETIAEKTNKGREGMASATASSDFAMSVAGRAGTAQRENFRAAMAGVARAQGIPEAEFVRGAEAWAEILLSTGRLKEGMRNFRPDFAAQGEGAIMDLLRYQTHAAPPGMLRGVMNAWSGKSHEEIGKILTDPSQVEFVRLLGRLPKNPRLMQALGASTGTALQATQQKGPEDALQR